MCFSFWTVTICNFQSPKLQYRFIRKHLHLRIYYAALSHRLYQLLYNMLFFCVLCSHVQAHWGVQQRRPRAIFFLSRQPYSCFSLLLYFVHFTFTPPAPNMIYQGLNGRVVGNIPHPFSVRLPLPTNEWSNLMWSALPAFDPPPPLPSHISSHIIQDVANSRLFSSALFEFSAVANPGSKRRECPPLKYTRRHPRIYVRLHFSRLLSVYFMFEDLKVFPVVITIEYFDLL